LLGVDSKGLCPIPSSEPTQFVTVQVDGYIVGLNLNGTTRGHTDGKITGETIDPLGGDDIRPFTSETINYIYERTGGFPREVIKVCNDLAYKAIEKNISTIDTEFLKETEAPVSRISMESIQSLPERQKLILDALSEGGEFTPSEIVAKMDSEVYKNRDNAIRSVNNLLRRLMKDGFVERKRVGKTYKYILSNKFSTLMVDA